MKEKIVDIMRQKYGVVIKTNGKKLTIEAADNSCCTPYVESLSVNNKVYDRNYITHKVLTEGGKLDFKMSGTPNQKRGTTKSAFPYSFSDDKR